MNARPSSSTDLSSSVTSECRMAKIFLLGLPARYAISYRGAEIVCPRRARLVAVLRKIGASTPTWGRNFLSETLDAVDAKILDLIQHDAGLSVAEIADRVGLSSSPCWRRIKRLEDSGVILRRVTILDRDRLGLAFEVYCTVKLTLPTKDNLEAFELAIARMAEVVQCATV